MDDRSLVIISALLHDIGKFIQRANFFDKKQFSDHDKQFFCPNNKYYSHLHALYTYEFLKSNFPWPQFLIGYKDKIAAYAGHHHIPSNNLIESVIKIADRISSGHDRDASNNPDKKPDSTLVDSPFTFIKSSKNNESVGIKFQNLKKGSMDSIYQSKFEEGDYQKLFLDFQKDLNRLSDTKDINDFMLSLMSLIENYWQCIPSAVYKSEPNITLYDHSKLTASIAEVLYIYYEKQYSKINEDVSDKILKDLEQQFKIISGDISGIQDFILGFDRSASDQDASKLIRGKSFYIQALAKSVVLDIQKRLGLSFNTQIMDAGGNFRILVPNTEFISRTIESYKCNLEKYLWDKFNGTLYINIAESDSFNIETLEKAGSYQSVVNSLGFNLEKIKLQKFNSIIKNKTFYVDRNVKDYSKPICKKCAENPVDSSGSICEICNQMIKIGSLLTKTFKVFVYHDDNRSDVLEVLPNVKISIVEDEQKIYNLKNVLFVERKDVAENILYPFSSIVSYIPKKDNNDYKTLEDISNKEGRNMLSLFKADIDDLGNVFNKELKETGISKQSYLSRMLALFWGNFIKVLIEKRYPDLYICYAGGDDAVIVGNYNDILSFALELRANFKAYSLDTLKFSAGIYNFQNKFPIRKAIVNCDALLSESKSIKNKDCVTVFGETLSWDQLRSASNLNNYIKGSMRPIQLFYRMLYYWRKSKRLNPSKKEVLKNKVKDLLILSHANYYLNKNVTDDQERLEISNIFKVGELLSTKDLYKENIVGLNYGLSNVRNINDKKEGKNE